MLEEEKEGRKVGFYSPVVKGLDLVKVRTKSSFFPLVSLFPMRVLISM